MIDRERNDREDNQVEARRRPEAGRAKARRREADSEQRRVRYQMVQDRLGPKPVEEQGQTPDQKTRMRPHYVIPRRDVPEGPTRRPPPRTLPSSYSGYVLAIPRNDNERAAFQHLMNKRMIFPALETGPERCQEPHFRFQAGQPRLDSDRADRR
jgi:hypothetical protein